MKTEVSNTLKIEFLFFFNVKIDNIDIYNEGREDAHLNSVAPEFGFITEPLIFSYVTLIINDWLILYTYLIR